MNFGSAVFPYSVRTSQSRVNERGYVYRRPVHRQARLLCRQQHLGGRSDFGVMWTDESRFAKDFNNWRLTVQRLPTERFSEALWLSMTDIEVVAS